MSAVGQGPSERIVAEAGAPLTIVDAAGRKLEFRRPSALDRLRLFKALGPTLSANNLYVGYAMLAFCVSAIDGVPVPQPASETQLEGLVNRLGSAGLEAVGEGMAAAAANP